MRDKLENEDLRDQDIIIRVKGYLRIKRVLELEQNISFLKNHKDVAKRRKIFKLLRLHEGSLVGLCPLEHHLFLHSYHFSCNT